MFREMRRKRQALPEAECEQILERGTSGVIAFGRVRVLEEKEEIFAAADLLAAKYCPSADAAARRGAVEKESAALCMLEMRIEHMTGKEAVELMRRRGK